MHSLPKPVADSLADIIDGEADAAALLRGLRTILDAESACTDLSRGVEGLREATRSLGILEETRSGQKVYEAWGRLSRFFLEPLQQLRTSLCGDEEDLREPPAGAEALGSRWERTASELTAFLDEQSDLDSVLLAAPVSTHVGYKIRTRILLLDRRAERLKVAVDLLGRDLSQVARDCAEKLEGLLAADRQAEESSAPSAGGAS